MHGCARAFTIYAVNKNGMTFSLTTARTVPYATTVPYVTRLPLSPKAFDVYYMAADDALD